MFLKYFSIFSIVPFPMPGISFKPSRDASHVLGVSLSLSVLSPSNWSSLGSLSSGVLGSTSSG